MKLLSSKPNFSHQKNQLGRLFQLAVAIGSKTETESNCSLLDAPAYRRPSSAGCVTHRFATRREKGGGRALRRGSGGLGSSSQPHQPQRPGRSLPPALPSHFNDFECFRYFQGFHVLPEKALWSEIETEAVAGRQHKVLMQIWILLEKLAIDPVQLPQRRQSIREKPPTQSPSAAQPEAGTAATSPRSPHAGVLPRSCRRAEAPQPPLPGQR